MSELSDLGLKWIAIANDDLEMAKIAHKNLKFLHASFFAQQAVEKSLKGIHVVSGLGNPPYSHDLVRLAEAISTVQVFDKRALVFFSSLNPFYIRARYPDYKKRVSETINAEIVSEFINQTEVIVLCLQDLLNEASKK